MIEHWYDYLPAAWFTPEGRWYVTISLLLILAIGIAIGLGIGHRLWKTK